MSLIYSMLMSPDAYVEDEHGISRQIRRWFPKMQIESQLELVSLKR